MSTIDLRSAVSKASKQTYQLSENENKRVEEGRKTIQK